MFALKLPQRIILLLDKLSDNYVLSYQKDHFFIQNITLKTVTADLFPTEMLHNQKYYIRWYPTDDLTDFRIKASCNITYKVPTTDLFVFRDLETVFSK